MNENTINNGKTLLTAKQLLIGDSIFSMDQLAEDGEC